MSRKNHIKRRAGLAAAVATLVLGAVPAFADTIKIGAYVSATGPNAFLGDPEMKTFRLYFDQINADPVIYRWKFKMDEIDIG